MVLQPIYFLIKNEGGMMWALLFFGLVGVGLYDVEERTYNTEVVQVDDGIFLQREDDMIFMVRFQGGEISFRKYD